MFFLQLFQLPQTSCRYRGSSGLGSNVKVAGLTLHYFIILWASSNLELWGCSDDSWLPARPCVKVNNCESLHRVVGAISGKAEGLLRKWSPPNPALVWLWDSKHKSAFLSRASAQEPANHRPLYRLFNETSVVRIKPEWWWRKGSLNGWSMSAASGRSIR